ncbi:hypothetical protein [Sphingomonas faeni]|nr:hypothetical protein [Sphingomonas faeni]
MRKQRCRQVSLLSVGDRQSVFDGVAKSLGVVGLVSHTVCSWLMRRRAM